MGGCTPILTHQFNIIMKKITLALLMALTSCLCFSQRGAVILQVEGIDLKKGGELSAGIFKEENFPKVGKQLLGTEVEVTGSKMEIRINNVPEGWYGVAVFQDIDKNKDLKTNFIGLPQEPIGFSNDARIRLGPPAFEDAQFLVQKDKEIILKIVLR